MKKFFLVAIATLAILLGVGCSTEQAEPYSVTANEVLDHLANSKWSNKNLTADDFKAVSINFKGLDTTVQTIKVESGDIQVFYRLNNSVHVASVDKFMDKERILSLYP